MEMDQIVCTCIGTTAQDIKDAMDNGAKTYEEIMEVTQAGTVCGVCEDEIKELMEKFANS